jgi:LmbE family N-acetylglucosaminyl deacetylase
MKRIFLPLIMCLTFSTAFSQAPKSYSSADILQQIKKLGTFGSVLYIAAHPDDENTKLLAYLANERKFRTGYLSLTRGDGGQNLIGDDQGIDLGLIRTQELLSARRIDGAEQFFSRAFDFGFSKNPEEALRIWGHDKILSDVVWVIRKFRPDVIITRFPTTGEGGHGHHTASAILAGEAFDAAADSTKFPEQLKYVKVWQAKRLLWNTFNFGSTNTTREDQFKIDCGGYNALLGKNYGELAAESRSRHRSQGFGVPAQRGSSVEYFSTIKGSKPVDDLMDGIDSSTYTTEKAKEFSALVKDIETSFSPDAPQRSLTKLEALLRASYEFRPVFTTEKQELLKGIIAVCAGLFMEATATNQLNPLNDSMQIKLTFNNRTGAKIDLVQVMTYGSLFKFTSPKQNENNEIVAKIKPFAGNALSQPYYLEVPMSSGSFNIEDQQLIGMPQVNKYTASFQVNINGDVIIYNIPIMYKYTDPVKGELYEPIQIVSPAFINNTPSLVIFSNNKKNEKHTIQYSMQANTTVNENVRFFSWKGKEKKLIADTLLKLSPTQKTLVNTEINGDDFPNDSTIYLSGEANAVVFKEPQALSLKKISYDHIPDVFYHYKDRVRVIKMDLKTTGSNAGYIAGAGDKVPQALEQMGYRVTMLQEKDITPENLRQFDVVITGVRAYNIFSWLSNAYPALMNYVREGGVLVTQYNTNNSIGPVKANISPYPFTISRNRITDEGAKVNFLLPNDAVLNYPNKITEKDFDNWIQERSIYNAENADPAYRKVLSMKDPGENDQDGSLIIADYGKGRFVYTGLVFFRELPAGVTGAYRLFANIIAKKN